MELFGFSITKKVEEESGNASFAPPTTDDGSSLATSGWVTGSYLDLEGGAKTEGDLINRYRDIAMYPDCDSAIEEIINECISVEDSDEIVELELDDAPIPVNVKKAISEEFNTCLDLLKFKTKAHDIFKRWYVDGRIYYHKILDNEAPQNGIQELRYIDPRKIKRIKQVDKQKDPNTGTELFQTVNDFYVYNDSKVNYARGSSAPGASVAAGIQIAVDSIAACTSGLIDMEKNVVIGHLHTAIKPTNQLRMIEDAVVINALVRAPLRRIFNVYTGNLPPQRAEAHVQESMNRFRNKLVYDASTGEMKDDKKLMSMLEDYWFPKGKDGASTTVENIEGGTDIANDDKLQYYQKKLYQSLKVPFSRMQNDGMINFGRQSEISKEELKFAKYINRLRRKFSELLEDILCTQLITKGILKYEDWQQISKHIKFKFNSDIYWQESKKNDILRDKLDLLNVVDPYVGKYFSKEYVSKEILGLSEEDQEEMQQEMAVDYEIDQQRQQQEMLAQMQLQSAQGEIK